MSRIPVLVVRPEPGNAATLAAARAAGLEAIGSPLFDMAALPWTSPDQAVFDGLLIGSANAIRLGGPELAGLRSLPVYAVGESTASAARVAGFTIAATGAGGLAELLPSAVADGRKVLLRLAGEEHVALPVLEGLRIETSVVYRAHPLAPTPDALAALRDGAVVLLHSAEAALWLSRQVEASAIDRTRVSLCCLGPRIAAAAGTGWAACRAAPVPQDAALLALATEMCQASGHGRPGKTG